jgi:uncharacterized protein
MPIEIHLHDLRRGSVKLSGELPAAELQLEIRDELMRAERPLRYDLEIETLADALLARGRLELALDCTCGRCLKEFVQPLVLADWALHLPFGGEGGIPPAASVVDLTPHLREDILLALPQHPLCETGCQGLRTQPEAEIPEQGGAGSASGAVSSSVWSDLDRLKL